MKKWLKRLFAGFLLILMLLLGATWYLLGTQSGVAWLLQTADSFVPGDFSVQQVEGDLLGQLRLANLKYETPDMLLNMAEVRLSWQPGELWQRVLHINELGADQIQFEWRKPPDDTPSEPLVLNDIKLPLEIRLDRALITKVQILAAADAAPIIIDELDLGADWTAGGLNLSKLALAMPEVALQGKGKLNPVDDYPLELSTDVSLAMEGVPKFKALGNIQGDLQQLKINQKLSGDVAANISADLMNVLQDLQWNLKLNLTHIAEAFLPEGFPENTLLDATGKGDLKQAKLDVQALLPAVEKVATEDASDKPATQAAIKLTANTQFAKQRFDVLSNWTNLQWPITGLAQYSSEQGELKLAGTADDYKFTLTGNVQGVDLPPGKLLANGKGNMQQIILDSFSGDILDGNVALKGKVAWKPVLSWEAQADATDINPQALAAEWPGQLTLSVSSSGQMKDDKLLLEAELKQLSGTLREKALSGSGKFKMAPDKISLQQLALNSGQAKLLADGELAEQWNLQWQLDVPDLSDLLPNAGGLIKGQGILKGDAAQPVVEGQLDIAEVFFQGMGLQTAKGEFSLGLNPEHSSNVLIEAAGLDLAEQSIEKLSLKLDGMLANHTLNVSVQHPLAQLQLVASGSYGAEDTAEWKGELQNLSLKGEETGDWQLKAPGQIQASASKALVEALCLHEVQQATELCVDADWNLDAPGKANLSLKQFSFDHLAAFLPPQITGLEGGLDAEVNAELGAEPNAHLTATIQPGALTYMDPSGQTISMQQHGGEILGVLDKQALKANWKLELDEHLLAGDLLIPRAELDADPMGAPLTGNIQMNMKDLNLITAFVPQVQKIDGSADVNMQISGRVKDPRISGHAQVKADVIDIPLMGLELLDTDLSIKGTGGSKLDITGTVNSGEGRLDLDGNLSLDAAQGWPLQLNLKGEKFQAANLPNTQVLLSPDIQLSTIKNVIKVRGKLTIPRAIVELKELPEGSESISSDVVIMENGVVVGESAPYKVDADVALELGEEINFKGFGAKAVLAGGLRIKSIPDKAPTANGELKILSGSYRAYGQDLTIESGSVSYVGGKLDNPAIRMRAGRRIDDITVGIIVSGTVKKLLITGVSSDPEMTSDAAIATLVTGQKSSDPGQARVYAGKELSENLSVGVNLGGGDEGSEVVVRYHLWDRFHLEGTSSSKKSGGRITYGFEVE